MDVEWMNVIGSSKLGYNLKKILFQKKLLVCQYLCFGTEHISQYRPSNLVFDHSQYNYFEVRKNTAFVALTKKNTKSCDIDIEPAQIKPKT